MDIRAMGATANRYVALAERLRKEAAEKAAKAKEAAQNGEPAAEESKPKLDAWTRMQG